MLSKNALFILGIIAGGSINPYAVNKVINQQRAKTRPRVPTPTIYGIINMLHRNHYIAGRRTKNGNLPERTMYSITSKGREALKNTLVTYLQTPEDTLSDLVTSILLLGHLDRKEVLRSLREYRDQAVAEIGVRKRMIAQDKERGVSYAAMIGINHILKAIKLNLKTVDKLIAAVENDVQWELGPVPFWRDRIIRNEDGVENEGNRRKGMNEETGK